ncbi:hypothetical protein GCM10011332_23660 [Terasakiella brassicae]|uniref:Helix-turn-helix domain-containing protein n=1 Tax=Terasakiella brassicae TaxID=1634917 RepID=A0A917C2I4_9PROT|nr:helix-turn-helix domain-containing protein [Terasakiella brassicae]GGF68795.1 hypothetical protein GCM10011332_23660 [Terasakiella brassicae]
MLNDELIEKYPFLKLLLERDPTWLDSAVSAEEASRLTGVSVDSLARYRSRGGGPHFLRPRVHGQELRIVRYFRRDLFEWLLSGGRLENTFDDR